MREWEQTIATVSIWSMIWFPKVPRLGCGPDPCQQMMYSLLLRDLLADQCRKYADFSWRKVMRQSKSQRKNYWEDPD